MKKKLSLITISIPLILLILIVIIRNIPLGYTLESTIYEKEISSQTIILGIPKLSFHENIDYYNFSYKNIREKKVITKEINDFLKTLQPIECKNNTYYYNTKESYTITKYQVENHYFYTTIYYQVKEGRYC